MQGRINQSFLQVQLNSVCFFVSLMCYFLPADLFSEFIFIYKHIGRIYLDDEINEKSSPRAVQIRISCSLTYVISTGRKLVKVSRQCCYSSCKNSLTKVVVAVIGCWSHLTVSYSVKNR